MDYKVSVIIPVYNAGNTLKATINSVINQTIGFENIELILVDDKSTDNSRDIIKEYSNTYSNIKPIFLEENSGCPGIPRNIGIKNVTSDYIMFIDDDDEYFPEMCDKLYNTMISEDVDVVVCDSTNQHVGKYKKSKLNSDKLYLMGEEIIYFNDASPIRSIFKKSIILDNNISFPDIVIAEDIIFQLNYHSHSKKFVYLDFIGYYHIMRDDSLSPTSFNNLNIDIKSFYILLGILKKYNCDLSRYFKHHIQLFILKVIIAAGNEGNHKNEIKELLYNLADFEREINFNGNLSLDCQFINYFILHGKLNIATHICLFISKIRKSNLILNIYRKHFLNFHEKFGGFLNGFI